MKTIFTTALIATGLAAGVLAAQAETTWHYPYKGTPYATQSSAHSTTDRR
jgi:hypothetical protein